MLNFVPAVYMTRIFLCGKKMVLNKICFELWQYVAHNFFLEYRKDQDQFVHLLILIEVV